MIYYQQGNATIHNGDCLDVLRTLPDESVHCCVTSPPYWGLRDYGHDGQIGLEETPEAYVSRLVEVFREVRRVLRSDGTLWLNLGDSYCSTGGHTKQGDTSQRKGRANVEEQQKHKGADTSKWRLVQNERHDCTIHINRGDGRTLCGKKCDGEFWLNCSRAGEAVSLESVDCGACHDKAAVSPPLKTKDLVGIPWRVAFALQADGWWLRQDIIWHKPNPMPESVRDRCTKAHEYVFLLAKSERYYYDAEAVAEAARYANTLQSFSTPYKNAGRGTGKQASGNEKDGAEPVMLGDTRNRRSVWTVSTKPYAGAHFATMPPDLVEPCIMAGTSAEGCCAACGAPWQRVVERETIRRNRPNAFCSYRDVNGQPDQTKAGISTTTLGWERTCECDEARVSSCTVLDPFNGAATVGLVSLQLQRRYIGIELNPEYCKISVDRINMEARQKRLFAASCDS